MKRGKNENPSTTNGYTRQQRTSTTKEVDQSESDDIEITISVPISKRINIGNGEGSSNLEKSISQDDTPSSSLSSQNGEKIEKVTEATSSLSSTDEELKYLIRSRLSKASGYKANPSYLIQLPTSILDLSPKLHVKKRSILLFIDRRKRRNKSLQIHLR